MSEPRRRTGPFWKAYKAVYWTFSIGLGLSVSISVTARTCSSPEQISQSEGLPKLSEDACRDGLKASMAQLRARARVAVGDPDLDSDNWSGDWRADLTRLRTQCGVERGAEASPLKTIADDLERLHLAWTTGLKGYAEVGLEPSKRLSAAFGEAETP